MAKTVKFNLICDNKPIRTIEDLQNNFSIEDILNYYNNKLLHKWLKVRAYEDELEKIKAITTEKPIEIIKTLIKIFKVDSDDKKIEEDVYLIEYLEERKKQYSIYEKEDYRIKDIINNYITGYEQLIGGILENPTNVAKIKANIAEIITNYAWIFKLNHRKLFYLLKDESVLAIMCLLMNEYSRKYFLPIREKTEDGTVTFDTDSNNDKANMFQSICSMITTVDFKMKLAGILISFSGVTDGYWKDLEPKGNKCLIISMGSGDFVRSAGLSGGDLSEADITNKFVIVDGIDYKSNSSFRQLLYMEV